MLHRKIDWGYVYNGFIVNLFLIWFLTFLNFCSRNFKFAILGNLRGRMGKPQFESL